MRPCLYFHWIEPNCIQVNGSKMPCGLSRHPFDRRSRSIWRKYPVAQKSECSKFFRLKNLKCQYWCIWLRSIRIGHSLWTIAYGRKWLLFEPSKKWPLNYLPLILLYFFQLLPLSDDLVSLLYFCTVKDHLELGS